MKVHQLITFLVAIIYGNLAYLMNPGHQPVYTEKPFHTETIKTINEFTHKFAIPQHIQDKINKHPNNCWACGDEILTLGIVAKSNNIDRVINAFILQSLNLKTIKVPRKYLYEDCRVWWQVAAEAVTVDPNPLDFIAAEIEDFVTLQEKMCYMDFHYRNIVRDKISGKITIIDTEDRSFAGSKRWGKQSTKSCLQALYRFIAISNPTNTTNLQLIKDRIIALEKNQESIMPINFLQTFQHPDNSGIDFKKIKKEIGYKSRW